jgi:CubicO group peptidase (beta-lactamase class C family)
MRAEDIARAIGVEVARAASAGCAIGSTPVESPIEWRREVGGNVGVLFDLASVTKSMMAVAAARSGIDPGTPLGALLAEARGTASENVPLDLFLAHRAGLAAHRPLYGPLVRGEVVDPWSALRDASDARRPDAMGAPPAGGFAALYSDLGYVLAGEAIARTLGFADAGAAIGRLVLEPLGIADRAGTVRDLRARGVDGPFAPTEDVAWRGGVVQGAVHDENAWALTRDGGSGHAGIFGTVDAVLTFGQAVLDALERPGRRGAPWGASDLSWLVRERPGDTLRAGFDGKSPEGSSAGTRMGPRAFGHLGFTGTSLWIDPDARVVVALLTNRVHPTRENVGIRAARPRVHDALFERALELAVSC